MKLNRSPRRIRPNNNGRCRRWIFEHGKLDSATSDPFYLPCCPRFDRESETSTSLPIFKSDCFNWGLRDVKSGESIKRGRDKRIYSYLCFISLPFLRIYVGVKSRTWFMWKLLILPVAKIDWNSCADQLHDYKFVLKQRASLQ